MSDIKSAPTSNQTTEFYDSLMQGKEHRGMLGKDTRFNPIRVAEMPSIRKFYYEVVKPYIRPTDRVLDFGCGPGSFMIPIAPLCREIVGAEISKGFVDEGQSVLAAIGLTNAKLTHIEPDALPFEDASFDVIVMVDVIHHLEDIDKSLTEAFRVLKPGGRVLIYEPNKLNPLLYLVHVMDRNEWGLLKLGTPAKYRSVLSKFVNIEKIDFNGIVIGPQSKVFRVAADLLDSSALKPWLGWLHPKMFITGTKI